MIYNISPYSKKECYNIWYYNTNFTDQIMDIEKIELPENSQDMIFMTGALAIIENPLGYLVHLKRFLKPNGQLFILLPDWEMLARKYLSGEITCGQLNLVFKDMRWTFDKNHLIEILQQAGFREFVEYYDNCTYYPEKTENDILISAKK